MITFPDQEFTPACEHKQTCSGSNVIRAAGKSDEKDWRDAERSAVSSSMFAAKEQFLLVKRFRSAERLEMEVLREGTADHGRALQHSN